ncbi:sigma-w pathway protein ysdB [Aneurinibacillus sp. REN35]|uniref:sigma-w pathway protein ysdB n=1 Tax=Aneurinibacillus sp. REN35 TaxID=3237286 RepID=UPI0035279324
MFRLLLLLAIIGFIIWWFQYTFNPKRKLLSAHEKKQTFFLDDGDNVRRNLLLTYKGVLFEGEKYLGNTEDRFTVIKVSVHPRQPNRLQGFTRDDFFEISEIIRESYPDAEIKWGTPIKEFLHRE